MRANPIRWLDAEHMQQVYRKAAQVEATVLWRGRMIGVWRHKLSSQHLVLCVQPFGKLNKTQVTQLERAAHRLANFYERPTASLAIVDSF